MITWEQIQKMIEDADQCAHFDSTAADVACHVKALAEYIGDLQIEVAELEGRTVRPCSHRTGQQWRRQGIDDVYTVISFSLAYYRVLFNSFRRVFRH